MDTQTRYRYSKWSIFACMYAGYTLYVINRKAFSFATPALVEELDLEKDDLGLIASSLNMAYAISKFFGGVMSDQIGSRFLFSSGLFLSGIVTICFTMFNSVSLFTLLAFTCGIVQGAGWPACANVLRHWFAEVEFGTMWGTLSTSMNVACSVGPLVATVVTVNLGWRVCMLMFGTVSLGMASICYLSIIDSPEDIGITGIPTMAHKGSDKDKPSSRGRGTWKDLLMSPLMWVLCVGYVVVMMTRTATLDWMQLFLIQECSQSPYISSMFVSSLETGGIIGSITAGVAGDKVVAMTKREDTRGSPRMLVLTAYVALIIISMCLMLTTVGEDSSALWILLIGFLLGFALYGPIALYGVIAMEAAPSHLAGTSSAIVSLASNVGAVVAGLPFSYLAKHYDWAGAFLALEVILIGTFILQVVTRNVEYKMVPIKKKLN